MPDPVCLFEKDPFTELEADLQLFGPTAENVNVRRPIYGMLPKWAGDGQARFSYLQVLVDAEAVVSANSTGNTIGGIAPISLIDSSAPGGFSLSNHNFIVQRIEETRQEKVQVIETFGDHFTFFYGEKPIVWRISGFLFNTHDFNWKNEWLANYDQFLRGTRCVENRARVFMGVDDVTAEGYILNTGIVYDKDMPSACPFNFSLLLTKPPVDLSDGYENKVRNADQARSIGDPLDNIRVEYLTQLFDTGKWVVDAATGAVVQEKEGSEHVPATLESLRSAAHITGKDPPWKGYKENPILNLNAELYAGQLGVDRLTAILAVRGNPGATQLGSRSDAVVSAESALGLGVSNVAVVVPEATPV